MLAVYPLTEAPVSTAASSSIGRSEVDASAGPDTSGALLITGSERGRGLPAVRLVGGLCEKCAVGGAAMAWESENGESGKAVKPVKGFGEGCVVREGNDAAASKEG